MNEDKLTGKELGAIIDFIEASIIFGTASRNCIGDSDEEHRVIMEKLRTMLFTSGGASNE